MKAKAKRAFTVKAKAKRAFTMKAMAKSAFTMKAKAKRAACSGSIVRYLCSKGLQNKTKRY